MKRSKSNGKVKPRPRKVPVVPREELDRARDFVRDDYKLGERVKVTTGDWASSRGTVESITAAGVTVRVHARLAVTVPAAQVQAI